jgi:phospholipase C
VIHFAETRFGVQEPNISAWRRTIYGDLTSCFGFAAPDAGSFLARMEQARELSARAPKLEEVDPL